MIRPAKDLHAIQQATAALQAARNDAEFTGHESLRQLLLGTVEDTIADEGTDWHALRRLIMRVHDCFRRVDNVVTVTTPALHGLLDTIEQQGTYINWLEGERSDDGVHNT